MTRPMTIVAAVLLIAACGKSDNTKQAAADNLQRDLQMAPADSTAKLNDQPTQAPPTPAPTGQKPTTQAPAPQPTSNTSTASGPLTLPAGTSIEAAATTRISSRSNKVGETLTATVSTDIKDSRGRVVIPAGSTVTLTITKIRPAENRSQHDGKITLMPATIEVGGRSYDLAASIESVEHHLEGRGVTAGDAAKVGGGAVAGAIAGRVLGGNKKGAIIGGVVGAAVGTGIAVETADRDVVIDPGNKIVLALTQEFVR